MNSKEKFVSQLFPNLRHNGVKYAIIKGYENHPCYENDIDLIVDPDDIYLLISLAKKLYTESNHSMKIDFISGGNIPGHHAIILFFLFNDNLISFRPSLLRLEIFQGIYLAKTILFSFREALNERRLCKSINAYVLSKHHEALVLLLSIHNKLTWQNISIIRDAKIYSQIKQFKALYQGNEYSFETLLKAKFGNIAKDSVVVLEAEKYTRFKFILILAKLKLTFQAMVKSPYLILSILLAKFKWDISRFVFQKFSLIYKLNGDTKQALEVADYLLKAKLFRDVIVCNSTFLLYTSLPIRQRRACEAVVILCNSNNSSQTYRLDTEIRRLMIKFMSFNAVSPISSSYVTKE